MAERDTETVRATDTGVRVERSVSRKDGGVTVEYTVSGDDGDAEVRIREPLDGSVPLTEAGFHPDHEPNDWSIEDGTLTFETTLPPDGTFDTVFGAVADEPFLAGDPEIERLDASSSGGLFAGIRGLFSRSSGGSEEQETDPGPENQAEIRMPTDTENADPGDETEAGTANDGSESEETAAEEPLVPDAEGNDPPDSAGGESGDGDSSADSSVADAPESESSVAADAEGSDSRDGGQDDGAPAEPESPAETEHAEADAAVTADSDERAEEPDNDSGSTAEDREPSNGDREPSETDGARSAADDARPDPNETAAAVVELVEEDPELRAALRDALDVETDGTESMDTRLRHVQARVDDLAAYTTAMEESIDEHGRPAEAFAELHAETAALRDDVSDLRADVAALESEQSATADRLDDLAAETEALRTELTEAGERRDARIDRVESDVDGVATDLRHTRDDFEEQLEAVRAELAELQSMRESLSAAFGGLGDSTGAEPASPETENAEVENAGTENGEAESTETTRTGAADGATEAEREPEERPE